MIKLASILKEISVKLPSSIYGITTTGKYIDFKLDENLTLDLDEILNIEGVTLKSLFVGDKQIKKLYCSGYNLKLLDVKNCPNLIDLECNVNTLNSLNIQGCINLEFLACENNDLTSLDVQGLTNLKYLYCKNNNLTSLNVQGCTNLIVINCKNNNLTSIDVQGCINLEELFYDEGVILLNQ